MSQLTNKQPRMESHLCFGSRPPRGGKGKKDGPGDNSRRTSNDHRHPKQYQSDDAMMLHFVIIQAVEEILVYPRPFGLAAGASEMGNYRCGCEADFPAGSPHSELPVGFLGVHKKTLIESADLLIGFAANHKACADDPIHLLLTIVWPAAVITQY